MSHKRRTWEPRFLSLVLCHKSSVSGHVTGAARARPGLALCYATAAQMVGVTLPGAWGKWFRDSVASAPCGRRRAPRRVRTPTAATRGPGAPGLHRRGVCSKAFPVFVFRVNRYGNGIGSAETARAPDKSGLHCARGSEHRNGKCSSRAASRQKHSGRWRSPPSLRRRPGQGRRIDRPPSATHPHRGGNR